MTTNNETDIVSDPRTLATRYLEGWKHRDFEAMRSTMADQVTFRGPLGVADGIEECLAGVQGLAEIITDIVVARMVVEGDDVITWYDLHTTVAPPTATANWSHVEDGKIIAIRATFDPRELIKG